MHKIFSKDNLLLVIIAVVTVLIGSAFMYYKNASNKPLEITTQSQNTVLNTEPTSDVKPKIMVDIKGEVVKPGIYELAEGSRINDAIILAGGLTENAYTDSINLAEKVADGQEIYVDRKYSSSDSSSGISGSGSSGSSSKSTGGSSSSGSSKTTTQKITPSNKLNINTATKNKLELLPGIGPALADRIIAHRQEKGFFKQPADIMNVSGIGPKKYEAIKDLIKTE